MEIVQRYNLFSGGGCVPPMWGLGMWYRIYGGGDEKALKELAEQFRKEEIPMDVLGLEPGWHSHSYSCTYKWSNLFPHPQEMIDDMTAQGYKLNLWEHVYVYPKAPFYEKLVPYSGDYEVWNGLVPDFATKEACQLFESRALRDLSWMNVTTPITILPTGRSRIPRNSLPAWTVSRCT